MRNGGAPQATFRGARPRPVAVAPDEQAIPQLMRVSDFRFELPDELIASHPPTERRDSRLLCLDRATGACADRRFMDFPALLEPGDLLVLNDTRVVPARLFGRKESGGRVEVMVERVRESHVATARIRAGRAPGCGTRMVLDGGADVRVLGREGELFVLRMEHGPGFEPFMEEHGHVPLPPYIRRSDSPLDQERYQTVYARRPGAVAAPTAGLHFDHSLLDELVTRGVELSWVTLHVGAGTFAPVRVEEVATHRMHSERLEVGEATCAAVERTRRRGGRVVAVGTTVVRALESAARGGAIVPMAGETDIFIYPGFRFRTVDAMLTNFHLPGSTLLMLVSAFAGRDRVLAAYRHAVAQRYRFFSYGDAMFIHPPARSGSGS